MTNYKTKYHFIFFNNYPELNCAQVRVLPNFRLQRQIISRALYEYLLSKGWEGGCFYRSCSFAIAQNDLPAFNADIQAYLDSL